MKAQNITCIRDGHYPFRDLIYDQGGSLRVQVFKQETELFRPAPSEIHFYGDYYGDVLAFETIGYKGEEVEAVKGLIRWYANWIGFPAMTLHNNPPL
ncbi:MAG TPA: hypothetical protein VGE15_12030 [Sphingobacteriaceae bacterium]